MKQIYILLLAAFIPAYISAQCSSCTISITGNDATDHVVNIGEVLCVQSTGTLTGRVYIASGGKLCNQGHINTTNILVTGGGQFDNYGTAGIDSLLVRDASAICNNYGTITNDRVEVALGGIINNYSDFTCNVFGDTAGAVVNNGNFTTNQDFYMTAGGIFTNNQKLLIKRDFANATGGTVTTSCVVVVQRDWYNQGTINGPASGCGGFSITGNSLNSGTVGATGHVDLCDAGHPTFGVDANSGTMTGVTFCQCNNTCNALGIEHTSAEAISFDVFPNPATDKLQVKIGSEAEAVVSLQNTLGQVVGTSTAGYGVKEISLNVSGLDNGVYMLTVQSNGLRSSRKVEIAR